MGEQSADAEEKLAGLATKLSDAESQLEQSELALASQMDKLDKVAEVQDRLSSQAAVNGGSDDVQVVDAAGSSGGVPDESTLEQLMQFTDRIGQLEQALTVISGKMQASDTVMSARLGDLEAGVGRTIGRQEYDREFRAQREAVRKLAAELDKLDRRFAAGPNPGTPGVDAGDEQLNAMRKEVESLAKSDHRATQWRQEVGDQLKATEQKLQDMAEMMQRQSATASSKMSTVENDITGLGAQVQSIQTAMARSKEELTAKLDTNGDGVVDKDEFSRWAEE
eukprot:COSAG02_NODE_20292_length_839_cov_1.010811_1_plen_279_part_11